MNFFADAVCVETCPNANQAKIKCPNYPTTLYNGYNFSQICEGNDYNSTVDVVSICFPTKTNEGTKFIIS